MDSIKVSGSGSIQIGPVRISFALPDSVTAQPTGIKLDDTTIDDIMSAIARSLKEFRGGDNSTQERQ